MWSQKGDAAVVIVDRTMDLITPLLHEDHLLDRLIRSEMALAGSATDTAVKVAAAPSLPFAQFLLPPSFRP
eukprot:scaffold3123_cov175-Prasinococcus_capsulatus_cf.AAC.1